MMSGKDFLTSHVLSWLATKGLFTLGRCYILRLGVPGLWASSRECTTSDGWLLDRWHQKTIGACGLLRPSAGKTAYWHERSDVWQCTSVKNSESRLIFNPLWNVQPVESGQRVSVDSRAAQGLEAPPRTSSSHKTARGPQINFLTIRVRKLTTNSMNLAYNCTQFCCCYLIWDVNLACVAPCSAEHAEQTAEHNTYKSGIIDNRLSLGVTDVFFS